MVETGNRCAQLLAAVRVTVPQLLAGQRLADPGVVDQGGEGDGVHPAVRQVELDGVLPRGLIPLHLEALNLHGRPPIPAAVSSDVHFPSAQTPALWRALASRTARYRNAPPRRRLPAGLRR